MERFLQNYNPKKQKLDKDINITKQKYEKEKRKRVYLPKWSFEFQWLQYDEITGNGMTCTICRQFETVGTFVTGCKNFKRETITSHEKSDGHSFNVQKHNARLNPSQTTAAKLKRKLNELTINQLCVKFRNAHYLSMKGRPFTDYVSLCELDESKGLNVGKTYRSDKSASEFSHFIAENERERIRKDLYETKFISVISDGSTDCSIQEAEIVYLRSCHHGEIKVNFSLVKNVPRGNAENIASVMIEGMKNLCGEGYSDKLVATGTDGAATMLGVNSGAVTRLKEATGRPWIVGVHCCGHRLELAFKDALKSNIGLFVKVDSFLTSIYYFYRNSNVNRSQLKESFKCLHINVLLPTRVGGTRWLGHIKRALQNFLRGYRAFVLHLGQLQNRDGPSGRTEKGAKVKNLYKAATSRDVWLMMHFMMDCLSVLTGISEAFQKSTASVSEVSEEITVGVANLKKLKSSDGVTLRRGISNPPDCLSGGETAFKSARSKFVDSVTSAMQGRFTDNTGIVDASAVVNLSLLPTSKEAIEGYGDEAIALLVDHFHDGLEAAGVDVEKCETEWTSLKHQLCSRFVKPNQCTWEEVNTRLCSLLPNILGLVDLVLTIPASSADAERGFNRLKMTKSDWRSNLSDRHLSDQLTIMLESSSIQNFDPKPAINLWNSTPRRLREESSIEVPLAVPRNVHQPEPVILPPASVEPEPVILPPASVEPEPVILPPPASVEPEIVILSPPASVEPETVIVSPPASVEPEPDILSPPASVEPEPVILSPPASVEPEPVILSPPASVEPEPVILSPPASVDPLPVILSPAASIEPKTVLRVLVSPPTSNDIDEAYCSDEDYSEENDDHVDEGLKPVPYKQRLVDANQAYNEFCVVWNF